MCFLADCELAKLSCRVFQFKNFSLWNEIKPHFDCENVFFWGLFGLTFSV